MFMRCEFEGADNMSRCYHFGVNAVYRVWRFTQITFPLKQVAGCCEKIVIAMSDGHAILCVKLKTQTEIDSKMKRTICGFIFRI